VTGIGGFFFRARDPEGLSAWYARALGLESVGGPLLVPREGAGRAVLAPFPSDTDYFGDGGRWAMVNLRVDDLDAVRDRLRAEGAVVDERTEDLEYGRFGWFTDPEGNRVELWQPAPGG
jgi:catechol 2,3-dioxygenase-like lactoylglutathione lyase family enzyme